MLGNTLCVCVHLSARLRRAVCVCVCVLTREYLTPFVCVCVCIKQTHL